MSSGIGLAREQLQGIADLSHGTVQIHGEEARADGRFQFEISIGFQGIPRIDSGLPVRARERFHVIVSPEFPFDYPKVETPHKRFAGFSHVQWMRSICLYPSRADWDSGDGMFGFISRLDGWVRDGAIDNLDPDEAPLHPPAVYMSASRLIVPRNDTPVVRDSPWIGFAVLRQMSHCTEITGWELNSFPFTKHRALAILLHQEFPFEYPNCAYDLLELLEGHDIEFKLLISKLLKLAHSLEKGEPILVVLGTPMRRVETGGPTLQHLAVWEISGQDADKLRVLKTAFGDETEVLVSEAAKPVAEWATRSIVRWCRISEMRPEVTKRRDAKSSMEWFNGREAAIWGCGAIGTHIAESIVRAGAAKVSLFDNQYVTHGLLVRQGFEDADVGRLKVDALADRLKRINPDVDVETSSEDLIHFIGTPGFISGADIVIDCTASAVVNMKLELALRNVGSRPPIASLGIDHDAKTGIATCSLPMHSGGPMDILRRLKLECCRKNLLSRHLDSFWPEGQHRERFLPEPGCSESTFIGSNADLSGLSSRMLNAVAQELSAPICKCHGIGWIVDELDPIHRIGLHSDHVFAGNGADYSVRVSPEAAREMKAWANRSVRTAGAVVETGGLIFGEVNDAVGVVWVTEVEGPPRDSYESAGRFTCGTDGMEEIRLARLNRFRSSVDCVGVWHTHPISRPWPSKVDLGAVGELLGEPGAFRKTVLLLILSGDPNDPELGAHFFERFDGVKNVLRIEKRAAAVARLRPQSDKRRNIGLALSGGGFRAAAFQLGCLRALNDLRVLDQIQVISSVSGGSLISAMYAYRDEPFADFDARVVRMLRQGLKGKIVRSAFQPWSIWKFISNAVTAAGRTSLLLPLRVAPSLSRFARLDSIKRPHIRKFSRSELFRDVLIDLIGDVRLQDVARDALQIVINATELRTGSAFRFGSLESGCWRFGTIDPDEALVAEAVASSAAHPAFFPALDRTFCFSPFQGDSAPRRVLLADGGIIDNIGVSPMFPGRQSSISTNVFNPDFIIACDAGTGLFSHDHFPTRPINRLHRSVSTLFRKAQDATRNKLHLIENAGEISGFALPYLGQRDEQLPWLPPNLPPRAEVCDYPTDLSAMTLRDIERLALRGEILTRFLIAHYLPNL